MIELILALAVAIPAWYGYKRSVDHGLVVINHVTTFSFGFLLYWVTPILVGVFGSQFASRVSEMYFGMFDKRLLIPYLASCIGLYVCFALGDSLGIRLFREKAALSPRVPKLALSFATGVGCALALYTSYDLRAALLLPYGTGILSNPARGALTSCVVLLGVVSLIYILDRPEMSWRRRLVNQYSVPFLAGCAVLLWMGTRLAAASFLLMFVVYQSNFQKRLKLRTVVWMLIIFTILLASVGMWRSNGGISDAVVGVVQEPVFASLSLIYHLRHHGIAWFNSPVYLASDFLNLIPTLVFPGKISLLKKPPTYGPLGGLHSFVSFDLNFGILGSAVVLFLVPIVFRYLRSRSCSTFFATAYVMCTGWLAFTFFRDPFRISVVKAMLEDSILVPIAVVALGRLLSAACSSGTAAGIIPEVPPRTV